MRPKLNKGFRQPALAIIATGVMTGLCASAFVQSALVQSAFAQSAAPQGAQIAASQCAQCHATGVATAPAMKPDVAAAPSFREIAQKPVMTKLAIRVFMRSTHPSMPDIILQDDEIDALADYIHSLR